ncbi:hypothetical protein A9Q81_08115 [Gammaproteobacteria bacterium 42_54_T18]|nr:hypothetical protein A9Q81_08115 [Gammaproteobacteria bacterium 42_54_T18]
MAKSIPMQILTDSQLADLVSRSSLLEGEVNKPKVLLDANGYIYKFFYQPDRKLSSRTLFPPFKQFVKNSKILLKRNVQTVSICDTMTAEDKRFDAIRYQAIEGHDFREHLKLSGHSEISIITDIMAELHCRGVFFRAIHLGNILHQPNGDYALIDISDCWFSIGQLNAFKRARNLAHLMSYHSDKSYFSRYGNDRFLNEYALKSKLNKASLWFIKAYIQHKGVKL